MTASFAASAAGRRNLLLLAQLREAFVPGLVAAFETVVAGFDEVRGEHADATAAPRWGCQDGLAVLRRRREEMTARLRHYLEKAWTALEQGRPLSAKAELRAAGQQGLHRSMETQLESRREPCNLATAQPWQAQSLLVRIEHGLGWAAGGLRLDADTDPAGPAHIGVALELAFAGSELATELRLMRIKLCERDLEGPLLGLYQTLERLLVGAGAPPRLPPIATGLAQPAGASSDAASECVAGGEPSVRAEAVRVEGGSEAASRVRQGLQDEGDHSVEAQNGLFQALRVLLWQSRAVAAASSAGTVALATRLSQHQTLAALSLLQASFGAELSGRQAPLAQRLKHEVLSSAAQFGSAEPSIGLDPLDEDVIDLIGMLFEALLDERGLEERSRALFGRLLVPFVKVARLDRRMFAQRSHPARRLLNALAEACEGNAGDSPSERVLMGKVEEIVERLVAEFNENLALFVTLDDEFQDFLAQHRRRVEIAERRAAETQRGQEKLDLARQRVQCELDARLAGRELPPALDTFLRLSWSHYLTLLLLREGEGCAALVEALALADGLLDELATARSGTPRRSWLRGWRPALQQVFSSVGLDQASTDAAIAALAASLQSVALVRPELERALPPLPLPSPLAQAGGDLGFAVDVGLFDPADVEHFRALPIGTWLDFIDDNGKVQAGKLSWISPVSARRLFVNRRGVRFCVVSPEDMASSARLGRLRAHAREDAFDSAMQALIDRLDAITPVAAIVE